MTWSRRRAFAAGVLAAGPAVLVVVAWHMASARPGFFEAISDGVTADVPLNVFSAGIEAFGPLAKGLLYVGIVAATLLAGGLFASAAVARLTPVRAAPGAVAVGLATLLLAELLVLPAVNAGFAGASLAYDPATLHLPLALGCLLYGWLIAGFRWSARSAVPTPVTAAEQEPQLFRPVTSSAMSRRFVLSRGLTIAGGLSLAGVAVGVGSQVAGAARHAASADDSAASTPYADPFGPTPAVTPVADFYQVNKNVLPTRVDGPTWRLGIDGLVDHPTTLDLQALRDLPSRTAFRTLECISNDVRRGDHLLSNQEWRGVPIADLLDLAGAQPAATWILWTADDGFTEATAIDVARQDDSWIAFEMGGQPLTDDHGFPARVLIAGRFGMKQPKWLRRMTLSDHAERGYWPQHGWDLEAIVRTMSRIDYPTSGEDVFVNRPFWIIGIANAGDRGISRVEVSLDGGKTWADAEIEQGNPGLGRLTWVRWRLRASLPKAGAFALVSRATDGTSQLQDPELRDPLPSGSTGYHRRLIIIG